MKRLRICVFCASSDTVDKKYFTIAQELGKKLAARGHELVYGGYTNGMMGKLAVAAHEGGAKITAVVPAIFDCDGFTYRYCDEIIKTVGMHDRKASMQRNSDAFIVLPGGIGTLDELFDTLDLRMLGVLDKRIIILNAFGFYDWLESLLLNMKSDGFVREGRPGAEFFSSCDAALDALEN